MYGMKLTNPSPKSHQNHRGQEVPSQLSSLYTQSLSILLTTTKSPKGVATNKSKSMLLIDIPNKSAKDTETKKCVEPGSIKALANKV